MSDTPNPRIAEVLDDIPVEYRDRFDHLLQQPLLSSDKMREYVERYLATVKQVGLMIKLLDMDQAADLGKTALALLDHLNPDQPPAVKILVHASVSYFVFEEEDEEITGVLGFDDDVQIFNAVSRALGRNDLILKAKRRD